MTKLSGFRELEAALNRLPAATGRNVLRRVARGALEAMKDDAVANAPTADEPYYIGKKERRRLVSPGRLDRSIVISEQRTRRVKKIARFDRKTGVEMAMGPSSGEGPLFYATKVEFGTVDTPAQPFMRPAWDGGKDRALEYVKDNLWREINAAAQRIARKGAKAIAADNFAITGDG